MDTNGLPVADANVDFFSGDKRISSCLTGKEGKFVCKIDSERGFTLQIKAQGFSILRQTFNSVQDFSPNAIFSLTPMAVREEVVITANRTENRVDETPASIVSLSSTDIQTTAAPTIDDALRQTAGFSIFRRSSSRQANPTSQGVSLRGVGSSGASRSLVLFDGIPLNDAFGGWVQWNRVPSIAVERIEVLRGGASSLYGNDALSGTVNIIPRRVTGEKRIFSAEIYGGLQKTLSGSVFTGFSKNGWSADLLVSSFQNRGYRIIDKTERGAIDDFAGSKAVNLAGRIAYDFNDDINVFVKADYFGETRNNGTPVQKNRTHLRQWAAGGVMILPDLTSSFSNTKFDWRVYVGRQIFDQTFSAAATDRNSETLNRLQRVPAQNFGFSSQFSTVLQDQTFLLGFETNEVRGASDEIGFTNNRAASMSGAGGRERNLGAFFQDFAKIGGRVILAGSLRFDSWKNFRGLNSVRTLSTDQTVTTVFADRMENALSPQISILYQISQKASIYASLSRSFRAPTLNELYRGFRVGSVVTLPNKDLKAEKANNFETGMSFELKKTYFRGNFFWTEIFDPVSNVTLTQTPTLITRQRQNAGKTRSRGFEFEAEIRLKNLNFSFGYLLADARVVKFPANPGLENLRIPQVPRQQFTFQTRYVLKNWTFALQGRASGRQFDDDLNTFELGPFFQLDAFAAKRFGENLQIFGGLENLFNARYSVGKTPVRSVSAPLNVRIGIRWQ